MKPILRKLEADIGMLGDTYPFNSHDDYEQRLSSSIDLVLDKHIKKEKNSDEEKLKVLIESGRTIQSYNTHQYGSSGVSSKPEVFKTLSNPRQAIEFFKEYYGLNTPQKSMRIIAEENNVTRETVNNKISFIKYALWKNKKDIWYGMI